MLPGMGAGGRESIAFVRRTAGSIVSHSDAIGSGIGNQRSHRLHAGVPMLSCALGDLTSRRLDPYV